MSKLLVVTGLFVGDGNYYMGPLLGIKHAELIYGAI
jgi:hypothetical protein